MLDKGSFFLLCLYIKMNEVYTRECPPFMDMWVYKHQAFRVLLNKLRGMYGSKHVVIPHHK